MTPISTKAQKNAAHNNTAVANQTAQHSPSSLQLADQRPEAIAQRKLQQAINNSPQTKQLKAYQAMANDSSAATAPAVTGKAQQAIVQRYPVEVNSAATAIIGTSGRPSKRTTKPVQEAIINDIFTYGAMNDYEKILHNLGKTKALTELRSNNWLSKNNAAVCHKNSIDDVENTLVAYGNMSDTLKASSYAEHKKWIEFLTARDATAKSMGVAWLADIRDSSKNASPFKSALDISTDAINQLIELIDASSSNYYIGHSGTNSGIQDRPDSHYDNFSTGNEAPATPISRGLYESRMEIETAGGLGHLSPVRTNDATGDWIVNSGAGDVNGKGWSLVDLTKGKVG
jgi:hypothetical protein